VRAGARGLGVSLVPESTLPDDLHGLRVLPVMPAIRRLFGLVCSPAGRASRATQVFMQELATAVAGSASGSA
jgi:DNA-binding transcriptional LysR family regulator